ncbi:MAG TPA: hypothetical protein VF017_06775 [Thermoanaerobaculia bacterium]|nr:hypothetical protein [Thermoanaerobaculia bacterium]
MSMRASRSVAEPWQELFDPARGRRRWRADAAGRVAQLELADGRELSLERDGAGRLAAVKGSDGSGLRFLPPTAEQPWLEVADPAGSTRVVVEAGRRSLERAEGRLTFEQDDRGRPLTARLPGSPQALAYRWRGRGRCELGLAGEPPLVAIETVGRGERFVLASGASWLVEGRLGRATLRAQDAAGRETFGVEIDHDLLGRTTARRFAEGREERFERDEEGRLVRWLRRSLDGHERAIEPEYTAEGWVAECGPEGLRRFRLGEGGRVEGLTRADGSTVSYFYDAAGRRTERIEGDEITRYRWDLFGQLAEVETPRGAVRYRWDGLGRRLGSEVAGRVRHEHRDEAGRLWVVTDEAGRALHTFLWWGGRILARLDGPLGSPLAEVYLTDPLGTPLAVLNPQTGAVEELETPLYGTAGPGSAPRPTLYGHFGDPETGLIHFGVRDLDPELGCFLTPDPWHGEADDPRRLAGVPPGEIAVGAELPARGLHAYALCRFDPVGRFDLDGHSAGMAILNTLLALSWGWPLTALSLYLFFPLNLYLEVILDVLQFLIFLWPGGRSPFDLPTQRLHIWNAIGAAASSRQSMFAFGLNGLVPRFFSSHFDAKDPRAVTIGNVVWMDREELHQLAQPRILEVWNLAGPPDPALGGAPKAGATRFNNNPGRRSVIVVEGTDKDGKKRLHGTYWTRGFGNTVVPSGADFVFEDRPNPPLPAGAAGAALISPGTMHMTKWLPRGFPFPEKADSPEKLEVREMLHTPGTDLSSDAELVTSGALDVDADTGFAAGEAVRVSHKGVTAVYRRIALVAEGVVDRDEKKSLLLDRPLPSAPPNAFPAEDLALEKVTDGAQTSAGWAQGANAHEVFLAAPAPLPAVWPPPWEKKDVVKVTAATAAPSPAVPAGGATLLEAKIAYANVTNIKVKLELTPALAGAAPAAGSDLVVMKPNRGPRDGEVKDPVAKPAEIELVTLPPEIHVGDRLTVKVKRAPATQVPVRVTAVNGLVITVDPPLGAPLVLAGPTIVEVQRYEPRKLGAHNKAKILSVAANVVEIEPEATTDFKVKTLVGFTGGGNDQMRFVDKVTELRFTLSEDVVGTGPFELREAKLKDKTCPPKARNTQLYRFLRHRGGARPTAYGKYPAKLLEVSSPGFVASSSLHYTQPDAATAATLHAGYKLRWRPEIVGTEEFWVLASDLPIVDATVAGAPAKVWVGEPALNVQRVVVGGFPALEIRELSASGAAVADTANRRVMARTAEVLVPEAPSVNERHDRALIEHELHHAVQSTHVGPMLGALPIQGVLMSFFDFFGAGGGDVPDWAKQPVLDKDGNPPPNFPDHIDNNTQLNWPQVFSIGGLSQLAWKYLFLLPAYFDEGARKKITQSSFSDWSFALSPVWRLTLAHVPEVDPNASTGDRWGVAFLKLLSRALDLRSWFPGPGLAILAGDGPQNRFEQGASRASGDLYSTILTANDKFNHKKKKHADLKPDLGDVVRLLACADGRFNSYLAYGRGDQPGSPVAYQDGVSSETAVTLTVKTAPAGGNVLLHPDLYRVVGGGGAAHTVEGPLPAPGGARPVVAFRLLPAGTDLVPRLPAMVPMPPRVNRSVGFYFVAGTPGTYEVTAFWDPGKRTAAENQAVRNKIRTHQVELKVGGTVSLGKEDVPWELPPAVGGAPTKVLERFLTELAELKVKGHKIDGWVLESDPPAILTQSNLADRSGWRFKMAKALPGGAGPHRARIRLFRLLKPNDTAFDLQFKNQASLAGLRSYLPADVWVPVRDFFLELKDLPVLPAKAMDFDKKETLELPIAVAGPGSITFKKGAAAAAVPTKKIAGTPAGQPRGEKWQLGPFVDPPEDQEIYTGTVTFGTAPDTVDRNFQLTVDPAIRLTNTVAGGPFEASNATPLVLDITGGTAPYTVEAPGAPAGTVVAIVAGKVEVKVNTAPAADQDVFVRIKDSGGRKGRRKVRIKA